MQAYLIMHYILEKIVGGGIINYLINVSERYENSTHNSLRYRIDNIVQIPYGLMYINLYKITKQRKYLNK